MGIQAAQLNEIFASKDW